jgi:hypothetical protein
MSPLFACLIVKVAKMGKKSEKNIKNTPFRGDISWPFQTLFYMVYCHYKFRTSLNKYKNFIKR